VQVARMFSRGATVSVQKSMMLTCVRAGQRRASQRLKLDGNEGTDCRLGTATCRMGALEHWRIMSDVPVLSLEYPGTPVLSVRTIDNRVPYKAAQVWGFRIACLQLLQTCSQVSLSSKLTCSRISLRTTLGKSGRQQMRPASRPRQHSRRRSDSNRLSAAVDALAGSARSQASRMRIPAVQHAYRTRTTCTRRKTDTDALISNTLSKGTLTCRAW